MAAEVKARITVDAANALQRIEDINKASGYTSASMSKMAKEIGAANAALSTLGAKQGGTASATAFKNISEQLEKQALAFSLVDSKSKAAANSATLYRNAIINLTKSGGLTKEQTDELVRTYNSYKTAAEGAKKATDDYVVSVHNAAPAVDKFAVATKNLDDSSNSYLKRLVTLTKNILVFQLIMGTIRSAISGVREALSDSVRVAAEAEQIYSKLSTVFDGFAESANRASSSLASSLGVAGSTAAASLSTVGDLLQAQGMGTAQSLSTAATWVSQFQDIIAFKDINMSLEEFAQNFMSGAAGNLRNFRTFGSIVKESAVNARLASEGLDKLTGSQLELAKMTARANMALEQQKNAMGATEREWDTMLSVNRRLNEAWKEYKENLGDTLNSFVKPFKRDIAEILDKINKSNRAAKELASGSLTSNVYNIRTNEKDRAAFRKDLLTEFNTYERDYNRFANGTITAEDTLGFEALDYVMRMYAASLEDVSNILGNKLPDAARLYLKTLEDARNAQIELNKAIEGRKTIISSASDRYGAFAESILGITGVSFNASSFADAQGRYSATEGGTNYLLGQIASTTMKDIDSALKSIRTSDLAETWGSVIGGALDELNHGELLQGRIDSVRQLFENTWNEFIPEGFTEEEKAKLEEIKTTYKGYIDELNAYNEELKRVQSFASALSGMKGVASDYDVQLAQLGMTDEQRATDNLRRQYATAYALAKTAEEQKQIDDAYAESEQTMLAFFNAQKKYNAELKAEADEKARLAKYEDAIKSINESTASYLDQVAQIGMTDEQKALDDLRVAFEKQMQSLNLTEEEGEELTKAYKGQVEALTLLQKKQREYNLQLEREAMMKNAVAQRNGTAVPTTWQDQLANFGLSSTEIARKELVAQRDALIAKHDSLWVAFQKEIDALDKVVKKISWQDLGNRALGSTGTLGSVVQSFKGDGDIWTKIFNAILTILENTENWGRIAEILDNLFAMFEPVTDAIINLIVALPWDDIIFVLKVVASAVVVIAGIAEEVIDIFKWLWNNIKIALKNVATDVYNLFHPFNKKEREQYKTWEELMKTLNDTAQKMVENTERVWAMEVDINNNLKKDDYAKQLALLKGLYDNGVLNGYEYAGSVAKVTGSSLGSIEKYDGATYATGGRGVTYFSGDIVINGYNRDPEDLAIEIDRVLERRSRAGANLYG